MEKLKRVSVLKGSDLFICNSQDTCSFFVSVRRYCEPFSFIRNHFSTYHDMADESRRFFERFYIPKIGTWK